MSIADVSIAKVSEDQRPRPRVLRHAIVQGIARANKTLRNVRSAWIKEQQVRVSNGAITGVSGQHDGHLRHPRLDQWPVHAERGPDSGARRPDRKARPASAKATAGWPRDASVTSEIVVALMDDVGAPTMPVIRGPAVSISIVRPRPGTCLSRRRRTPSGAREWDPGAAPSGGPGSRSPVDSTKPASKYRPDQRAVLVCRQSRHAGSSSGATHRPGRGTARRLTRREVIGRRPVILQVPAHRTDRLSPPKSPTIGIRRSLRWNSRSVRKFELVGQVAVVQARSDPSPRAARRRSGNHRGDCCRGKE